MKEKKATKMENGDNGGINGIGEKERLRERIEATQNLDSRVGKIWDSLPPNSLLLIATAVGDSATLRYKQEEKWARNRKFSEAEESRRKKKVYKTGRMRNNKS